ncbi:hypothetical protein BH10BAC5_BH10BAC5_02410 [soil metagenome]
MKYYFLLLTISIFFISHELRSQDDMPELNNMGDTFSICAIDMVTGEVGSAGASCVAGSIILSDVHPGRGVIHSQASYLSGNQTYARSLMNLGLSPQQIIDSVVAHDVQNNPTLRQYGVVDNVSGGRFASYTGVNCTDWKGHTNGLVYSIQGNILLGQRIIDSMKTRFLNTPGSLAARLMAALQGAKVIGADTRCNTRGTSSISSFLRIGKPTDPQGGPYFLDLNVNNTPTSRDPIDSLQVLYNRWIMTGVSSPSYNIPQSFTLYQNFPNPFNPTTTIRFDIAKLSDVKIIIYDIVGKEQQILEQARFHPGSYTVNFDAGKLSSGIYYFKMFAKSNIDEYTETKKMTLIK